jgi:UDP-N-acetylglucosamine--N-acetylmuramyl-(pentapeptide) pyrophosphoryl-undecaprenol N-acetylglucosamine transferase
MYSSFEEGLDYLVSHGKYPAKSPAIDLKWSSEGGFSSKDSFLGFPRAIITFFKQIGFESDLLSRFGPKVVLSDSRVSPIFAAKSKSIPVVTLLNQFKVLFPSRFRGNVMSNFYERIAGNVLGLFWSLSDEVLMSDLPPPYTIGEANVKGTDVSNRLRYVGFTSPNQKVDQARLDKVQRALELDQKPLVFIQISGPNATKKNFLYASTNSMAELSRKFNVVLSLGYPKGSSLPKRVGIGAWVYDWCPVKDELLQLSSAVVSRAGHGTIGQCINLGKPAVLVPIFNHSEQIANADKYQKLGLGVELRSEQLTRQKLIASVSDCVYNPGFREKSRDLMEISNKMDGVAGVVETMKSYL